MDIVSKKQQNQHGIKQYKLILFAAITISVFCAVFVGVKLIKVSGYSDSSTEQSTKVSIIFENEAALQTEQVQKETLESEKVADKININTASKEQLMALKGIGEVKAQAILTHRHENGKFQSIYDIVKVFGIGEKTFENIKDKIIV